MLRHCVSHVSKGGRVIFRVSGAIVRVKHSAGLADHPAAKMQEGAKFAISLYRWGSTSPSVPNRRVRILFFGA